MELELLRREFSDHSTIGDLIIDGEYFCYTLEDKVREVKIKGETAIPFGRYEVVVDYSARFKRNMPHILNVAGFEGIRIHNGNTDKDTEGCILLGYTKKRDFIGQSIAAFHEFSRRLDKALETEKVFITIK